MGQTVAELEVTDPREQDRRRYRSGDVLRRAAPKRKHLAQALGVSSQRASQLVNGEYPWDAKTRELLVKLARHERTAAEPVVQDYAQLAMEAAYGDYETSALLRELATLRESIRDAATILSKASALLQLLSERGVA